MAQGAEGGLPALDARRRLQPPGARVHARPQQHHLQHVVTLEFEITKSLYPSGMAAQGGADDARCLRLH